ncbi:MAG: hypothetical protein WCT20_02390 [Candidatus Babeliales bacterium]
MDKKVLKLLVVTIAWGLSVSGLKPQLPRKIPSWLNRGEITRKPLFSTSPSNTIQSRGVTGESEAVPGQAKNPYTLTNLPTQTTMSQKIQEPVPGVEVVPPGQAKNPYTSTSLPTQTTMSQKIQEPIPGVEVVPPGQAKISSLSPKTPTLQATTLTTPEKKAPPITPDDQFKMATKDWHEAKNEYSYFSQNYNITSEAIEYMNKSLLEKALTKLTRGLTPEVKAKIEDLERKPSDDRITTLENAVNQKNNASAKLDLRKRTLDLAAERKALDSLKKLPEDSAVYNFLLKTLTLDQAKINAKLALEPEKEAKNKLIETAQNELNKAKGNKELLPALLNIQRDPQNKYYDLVQTHIGAAYQNIP